MNIVNKIKERKLLVSSWPKGSCFLPKRSLVKTIKNRKSDIAIIGEVRNLAPTYSNPSKYSINELISVYQHYLSAITVFTDNIYFGGCFKWLSIAKEKTSLPIVALDFIIQEEQISCINSYGADAIVLIAGILSFDELYKLSNFAKTLGLEVIIEVQNEEEVKAALRCEMDIIGINTRNLRNLSEVDLEKPYKLKQLIPDHIPIIIESGIKYLHDLYRFRGIFDAVLVGSAFVESENLEIQVKSFVCPDLSDFYPFVWVKPAAFLQNKTVYNFLIKYLNKLGFQIEEKILTNKAPEIACALYRHELINRPDGLLGYHIIAAYYDFLVKQMGDNSTSEIIFLKKKHSLIEDLKELNRLKIYFRTAIDNTVFIHQYLGKIFNIEMHSFHVPDPNIKSYERDLSILMKYPCLTLSIKDYIEQKMYLYEQWYKEKYKEVIK